jgi:DNA repair protein RecO (recombination protein O)
MLQKTNGIVLRAIKYGDTSLVVTIFTATLGLQIYMVQGVRTSKTGKNRAAYFQPGMLLDMVVNEQPQKNMQRIREYNAAYIYDSLRQDVVKNSIALFSVEVLLRLLPEHAPMSTLFELAWQYFITLDETPVSKAANFPLYFIMQCSREFGYDLKGSYSTETPYLHLQEGGFADHPPMSPPYVQPEEASLLSELLKVDDYAALEHVHMNAEIRMHLTDWFIAFLQQHTQHMGNIKSLSVLRTILH